MIKNVDFEQWIKCLEQAMDSLKLPDDQKQELIEMILKQKGEICQMEAALENFTSIFREQVQSSVEVHFKTGKIDSELKQQVEKCMTTNQNQQEAIEMETRLFQLFQNKKLNEYSITEEEMHGILQKTDTRISPAIYYISDILQE